MNESHARPYVVLLPKSCGNPTDKHLVVQTDEYVRVTLKEQETYTLSIEHDDYGNANRECIRLITEETREWTAPTPSEKIPTKASDFWEKRPATPAAR